MRTLEAVTLFDMRSRIKGLRFQPQPIETPRMEITDLTSIDHGVRQALASEILSLQSPGAVHASKLVSPCETTKPCHVNLTLASPFDHTFFDNRPVAKSFTLSRSFLNHSVTGRWSDLGRPVLHNRSIG